LAADIYLERLLIIFHPNLYTVMTAQPQTLSVGGEGIYRVFVTAEDKDFKFGS